MKKIWIIGGVVLFAALVFATLYTPKYTKFNKDDWNYKMVRGHYSRRYDMLEDLLKNHPLKGMNVSQLYELFGSSDMNVFTENDTLKIAMNVFTANGWRPVKTKDLILYLDKDSVVTSWRIREQLR